MRALFAGLALLAGATAMAAPALAQGMGGEWLVEFRERPAADGGDIRYAIFNKPGGAVLQLGCTPNRIERVLIRFASNGGPTPNLPRDPAVQYAFDNEAFESADWPLFEAGSIEVPRGGKSSAITRRVMSSLRFQVRAQAMDGQWHEADFNVAGGHQLLRDMLDQCGIR
ncbi:MAG: hypothetical protein ACFCUQ_17730 [Kiloniellales bacterium]